MWCVRESVLAICGSDMGQLWGLQLLWEVSQEHTHPANPPSSMRLSAWTCQGLLFLHSF